MCIVFFLKVAFFKLSLIAYWYCSDDFPTWEELLWGTGISPTYLYPEKFPPWSQCFLLAPFYDSSISTEEPMVPPWRYEDFKNYTRAVCCSKCGDCKKKVGTRKGFLNTSWPKINLQPQRGFWVVFAVMFHIVSHEFSCSYGSEPTTLLWHTVQTHVVWNLLPYVDNTICHELFLSIHKSLLLLQKIITIMGKQVLIFPYFYSSVCIKLVYSFT